MGPVSRVSWRAGASGRLPRSDRSTPDGRRLCATVRAAPRRRGLGVGPADTERIKAAVLVGSLLAADMAAPLVKRRNSIYRRLWEAEHLDEDADGIPDIHQRGTCPSRPPAPPVTAEDRQPDAGDGHTR